MATIITKNSQTASAVPAASSLEVGELAVNTADGKLYTEHTGGVVKEIIPSTVVDGGITAAKIASNAVTTIKIADANVTGAKLENSGVTAGTYTTATVTVDAKGRVTSASSGSVGGVTSLNGQTGSITNTNYGSIGSYVIAGEDDYSANLERLPNNTVAGSSLYRSTMAGSQIAGINGINSPSVGSANATSLGLSGTWRRMTRSWNGNGGTSSGTNLYVRIS
jgi:hypothetical protein